MSEADKVVESRGRRGGAKRRILRSATVQFAKKGPDAAMVEKIARNAGYSKRMVYHYFGSKEGLYLAVLQSQYDRLQTVIHDIVRDGDTLFELLDRVIYEYFSYLQENPEFVQLLNWENSRGALGLKQINVENVTRPLTDAMQKAMAAHSPETKEDAASASSRMVISCLALCSYYFTNRYSLSEIFGIDLQDPDQMQRWISHVRGLILSGIAGEAESSDADRSEVEH